jgi:hypothetical protein
MEKPGMDRRNLFHRTGLLILLVYASLASPLIPDIRAQSGEEPAVTVETSPEHPLMDGSWRISILVNHPVPDEVSVNPPDLPSSLTFAQVRKTTRLIRTSLGERNPWTLVEFLFVPHRTGAIALGAFEVITPWGTTKTRELRTQVIAQEGVQEEYHPRLVWDSYPSSLGIGESAELSLRILDWDKGKAIRPAPFRVTAPSTALLEELPLTTADLDQGRVLRLRLIPLEGTRLSLGHFPLRLDSLILEVPAITIRLTPAGSTPGSVPPAPDLPVSPQVLPPDPQSRLPDPLPATAAAFPEVREEVFPLFRKAYGETVERAQVLWGEAHYAEALGELRRGERDLMAGPALAALRQAAEQSLGIAGTENEQWRPRSLLLGISALVFCLLILLGKNAAAYFPGRGYKGIILIIILGLGVAGFAGSLLGGVFPGGENSAPRFRENRAVLHACSAYRVPDTQGAISAHWKEGQPVTVRVAGKAPAETGVVGVWAYTESADGDAGWVLQENLVFYLY